MEKIAGTQAVHIVEMWGRRFVHFSLRVCVTGGLAAGKREGTGGGKGIAFKITQRAAFCADFERALSRLTAGRRLLLLGSCCLSLPIQLAGRIAGFGAGNCYRVYEESCMEVYRAMKRGGYEA